MSCHWHLLDRTSEVECKPVRKCELIDFLQVHPAAKIAEIVRSHGGKIAVFNTERTKGDDEADFLFLGSCEETLPPALGVV